ncbi:hypothetical protein [Nocardioides sambongensis]|uniref:hypothetical protein n=1 Tax=Nocardioides sambongensis TaxID=2589074 RepID=UPI00112862A9|nr:hypothetical protein [Nocardioides sambongensis]
MEILLWLAPAGIVTVVTMLWVAWWGRERRDERRPADRDAAARRLGAALERADRRGRGYAVPRRGPEVSHGVALRAPRPRPVVIPGEAEQDAARPDGTGEERGDRGRRAS